MTIQQSTYDDDQVGPLATDAFDGNVNNGGLAVN
jgi:hypothetical protein